MKKMIAMVGFALASVFAPAAKAQNQLNGTKDRLYAVVETTSHHFSSDHFNEFNPGIGAEYRLTRAFHVGAGVYNNSIGRASVYALAGVESTSHYLIGAGLEVGAVSGYLDGGKIAPAALPYIRLGSRKSLGNIKVSYIPDIKNVTPAVVTFQARIKILDAYKRKH